MTRFSKFVSILAALPILAIASPVLANSPGQLTGGSNTYLVKNLTQKGEYASSISTACGDELQYSIRLHNAAFGGLTNIQVSANLVNSKMTATPAEGASQGTTGSVSVSLPTSGSIAYQSGTTVLYDSNGNAIKTLPDGITTVGVNIGDIAGSTTKFVNFKAKVACPPVTPPKVEFACKALDVNKVSRTRFDFTAHASASNATVQSYVFTAKDANGNVVDTETVTTSALSAGYTLNQDKPGKYTVSVVVKTDHGDAAVDHCVQTVTVEEEETPPTTPPAVKGGTTELPNTGAGSVVGLFAGVSVLATAGHFAFRRFIG
jgi:hypothetical protein